LPRRFVPGGARFARDAAGEQTNREFHPPKNAVNSSQSHADAPALDPSERDDRYPRDRFVLDCGDDQQLDLRPGAGPAKVMGILNVTPDSFSDGGQFLDKGDALARVEEMLEEGADVVDVGGESSRPAGSVYGEGAAAVAEDEEKRRVLPVVEAVAERFPGAILSVDTYKPGVARAALEAGAHLINDITGLRIYPETAEVCAKRGAPLAVMHSRGRPGAFEHAPEETGDVAGNVADVLAESVETAEAAGVRQVVVDPGFGFGKTPGGNLRLLNASGALLERLGRPVLVGISRKSTIGDALAACKGEQDAVPVGERLFGTLGATAVAVMRGATLVRTHDVRATVEMLYTLSAASRGSVGAWERGSDE
jgi:dihydropteroate synthase